MYWVKYESNGKTLDLTPENEIYIATISGATGTNVSLKTSQGFQQIGNTVESMNVGGKNLQINGIVFDTKKKEQLLKTFVPFSKGRLVWEDKYFIDVVVSATPTIVQERYSKFSLTLYAPFPFWKFKDKTFVAVGKTLKEFRFPINYSIPHRFGTVETGDNIVITNEGDTQADFSMIMLIRNGETVNPRLYNVETGQYIRFIGAFHGGDIIKLSRSDLGIDVTVTQNGIERTAFDILDDSSNFYSIPKGESVLSIVADEGRDNIAVSFSYYQVKAGVLSYGV